MSTINRTHSTTQQAGRLLKQNPGLIHTARAISKASQLLWHIKGPRGSSCFRVKHYWSSRWTTRKIDIYALSPLPSSVQPLKGFRPLSPTQSPEPLLRN